MEVHTGRVLYVNLELDRASCLHRFRDVYQALGWEPDNLKNIDIWNLRGKSRPMDKLAPMLIRRAAKKNYIAIVIDPIYKVITGDENSADQMANFCNQFDKVCTELGVAVIYCHHHSKGGQGSKKAMDRASGSGCVCPRPGRYAGYDRSLNCLRMCLRPRRTRLCVRLASSTWMPILNGRMTCQRMIYAAAIRCSFTARISWTNGNGRPAAHCGGL